MKIVYTKHALGKFNHLSVIKLGITKKHIQKALEEPDKSWTGTEDRVELLVKKIDETHDLRVVSRTEGDIIIIITFHPAKRGRYEKPKS